MKTARLVVWLVCSLPVMPLSAQERSPQQEPTAALALQDLMQAALSHYPSMRAQRLEIEAAQRDLQAVERLRWGSVSVVAEAADGKAPAAATRLMRLEQTLWDSGGASAKGREAQARLGLAGDQLGSLAQDLQLQLIQVWQSWMSAQG